MYQCEIVVPVLVMRPLSASALPSALPRSEEKGEEDEGEEDSVIEVAELTTSLTLPFVPGGDNLFLAIEDPDDTPGSFELIVSLERATWYTAERRFLCVAYSQLFDSVEDAEAFCAQAELSSMWSVTPFDEDEDEDEDAPDSPPSPPLTN